VTSPDRAAAGSRPAAAEARRLQAIVARASERPALRVAVVDAAELHVLQAACEGAALGLLEPVLVGAPDEIARLCEQAGGSAADFEVVAADSEQAAAARGVELVLEGRADALMKGWIHTDVLMRPVLAHLRTERRISHVFAVDLASYHKLLFVTDAAINVAPDLDVKAAIVANAVGLLRLLGIETPRVAALSAIELVKGTIASTIDAACLSKMAARGQIRGAIVDGPLAFDNAISREAARIKQIESPVAGEVDILLAPDLDSGNILAKDLEYLAGAVLAGIVLGARVPIVLTSRSDPPAARIASVALASLAHGGGDALRS